MKTNSTKAFILFPLALIVILAVVNWRFVLLTLHVQDEEIARTSDCGATRTIIRLVPRTESPIDASIRALFARELSTYATYESVTVENGIARILVSKDADPEGRTIGSLSSCEGRHLFSVLLETLRQYGVSEIELHTAEGKVEF